MQAPLKHLPFTAKASGLSKQLTVIGQATVVEPFVHLFADAELTAQVFMHISYLTDLRHCLGL